LLRERFFASTREVGSRGTERAAVEIAETRALEGGDLFSSIGRLKAFSVGGVAKVRLEGRYSAENWLPVRPLRKRALRPRLIRVASLLVISLLSVGLWVAISEAVISVASAVR
jgi:hypothetical protein